MYLPYLRKIVLASVTVLAILAVLGYVLVATGASAKPAEPVNEPRPRVWDACRWDDGSDPPCVWDARHLGNHVGHSFKALRRQADCQGRRCKDPRIVYLTHRRAHLLLGL